MKPTPLAPLLALLGSLTACAAARPPAPAAAPAQPQALPAPQRQPRAIVLRHATVLPVAGPAIADGAVLLAEGRVVAVGPSASVPTPAGAEELDVRGKFVTPGLIDAHSHLGVYPSPGSLAANDDGNEMSAPVTAEVSAEHAFWPQDPGIRRALAGGVTSMLVVPGSANLVGGRGITVKLRPGRTVAEMRFPGARESLKVACGENPKRIYGKEKKSAPMTRMGNAALFRQAFEDARDYVAKRDEWRRKEAKRKGEPTPAPKRDLKLETLAAALAGEVLVQVHCYRAEEMEAMLRMADELGFRVRAFHHATEAYKIRDLLAARGVAVATWADWWGFKLEAWDGIPENAGLVTAAGGRAVIHSDDAYGIQRLNQEAAKALARAREAGLDLDEQDALRWVTLDAAWILGVEERTGSLEPGKMADVVVWSRPPLSVYARAEKVFVDGLLAFDVAGGLEPSDFELAATPRAASRPASEPIARPRGIEAAAPVLAAVTQGGGPCTAITGATALADAGVVPDATVIVRGERVEGLAPGGAPPAGCRVVDGRGRVLTAGLVDPASTLGLVEILLEADANDSAPHDGEGRDPIRAALRAADSVNPASALFPVARLGGLTGAIAAPAGGLVSGQAAYVTTDGVVRRAPVAVAVNLGGKGARALESTRGAALERLRELFDDARAYAKRRGDFEQNRMRRVSASRLDLEALQRVLAGEVPLVVSADRAADLRAALAFAREEKVRIVVEGGAEAWLLAEELAAARVPVIVDPAVDLPDSFDALHARPDNAALLAAAGVSVLVSGQGADGEPHRARTLAQAAGNAVAWGLPYEKALRAIGSGVAEVFGLDAGRLAPGGRADLVLWSGDPLELSTRPLAMWIAGRQVPLASRQQALLERYRQIPGFAPARLTGAPRPGPTSTSTSTPVPTATSAPSPR